MASSLLGTEPSQRLVSLCKSQAEAFRISKVSSLGIDEWFEFHPAGGDCGAGFLRAISQAGASVDQKRKEWAESNSAV